MITGPEAPRPGKGGPTGDGVRDAAIDAMADDMMEAMQNGDREQFRQILQDFATVVRSRV